MLTPLTQSPPNDDWHIEFAKVVSEGQGRLEEIKRFINYGINPNSRGRDENYPIHIATLNGHDAIVTLLIEAGADIHARGENGRTPLHHAVQINRLIIVRLLWRREAILAFAIQAARRPRSRSSETRTISFP